MTYLKRARKISRETGVPIRVVGRQEYVVDGRTFTTLKAAKQAAIESSPTIRSRRKSKTRANPARRRTSRNPRYAALYAQKTGGPLLKYVGGIRFSQKGRAVLFDSVRTAEALGRALKRQFPILKRYRVFARA